MFIAKRRGQRGKQVVCFWKARNFFLLFSHLFHFQIGKKKVQQTTQKWVRSSSFFEWYYFYQSPPHFGYYYFPLIQNTVWKFRDSTVTQILREINLGNVEILKMPILLFLGSEFCWFGQFWSRESAKITTNQNSEPQNVIKWHVLRL